MTHPVILLLVFAASLAASALLAKRLTRVNVKGRHPERSRHWSASGIPRIGGIAVFGAAPVAILLVAIIPASIKGAILQLPELAGPLILASAILFTIGLLDDLRGVPPLVKLVAQTAAALIVYAAGFSVENVSLIPGHTLHLGVFALPATVLWLVGVSNAFNLIDGLDGLAGGVAIIALVPIAIAGLIIGDTSVPVYSVALMGALFGFLRYNWPPARLFMGDSGSLVVGFLLALLSIRGATNSQGVTLGLIPIFALAYPLLDTGVAILRRWLRGVPISRADTRHVHNQLCALGMGPRKALAVIYFATGAIAGIGLVIGIAPPEVVVLATLVGVGILMVVMGAGIYWLEYHEFLDAGASFAHAVRKSRTVIQDKINARDLASSLREARNIEEVQTLLAENAETFRFAHMKLSDPFSRKQAAGRITQELQTLKLWKLEYPILQRASDQYDGLCLTIWSSLANGQRPAGAERVARILAPAIAEWVGGRKRTPEETRMAERGIVMNPGHAAGSGEAQRSAFIADLRLFDLESSEPGNSLEA